MSTTSMGKSTTILCHGDGETVTAERDGVQIAASGGTLAWDAELRPRDAQPQDSSPSISSRSKTLRSDPLGAVP
jgi:hypothetical protein